MNRTLRDVTAESYAMAWMLAITLMMAEYEQFLRKYFNQG
jgi:hypothetical protein